MELFETNDNYIVLDENGRHSLWCSRNGDGHLTARSGSDLEAVKNPICLGHIYGVIGKIVINSECQKLLLICRRSLVGQTPGCHRVFAINNIAALPLSKNETPELPLEPCKRHNSGIKNPENKMTMSSEKPQTGKLPLKKTWNSIKTATSQVKYKKPKDSKDRDKFERRVTDELIKMFTDSESFYYSHTADLTNSVQRQWKMKLSDNNGDGRPLWQRVDDRFFWNYHMLQELIDSKESLADPWIIPVIQGFIQIEKCSLDPEEDTFNSENRKPHYEKQNVSEMSRPLNITIISRRSRYRAGTRYRRRGVDESGKVANYVETEQIIEYEQHIMSFIQVRGSVPVYWSQPGYKYRPPPRLDKGEEETQIAFEKHFTEEYSIYDAQAIINLVEQNGKEKVIADAYLNHILKYDSEKLTYITFDFHEYCRGMRFENVSVLILSIQKIIREMVYCWTDKQGIICEQKGTFRINCIDCLDRTNVVQTALAKAVLEIQFTKLGVVPPEGTLPYAVRNALQVMWANNGDCLSRQYAGTAALKSDYTRTGERRFTGMVKDGYNSANRQVAKCIRHSRTFYIKVVRDLYRQASVCLMLGEMERLQDLFVEAQTIESRYCLQRTLSQFNITADCITYNDLPFGPETYLLTATTALTRYYLNRFKDAYRQAAIDMMLGKTVSEEDLQLSTETCDEQDDQDNDNVFILNQSEHVKQLIEDCKKMLVPESEVIIGGWALIDADPVNGDPSQQDADTILILTRDSYYVVSYDDEIDRITNYQRVLLVDVEKIDLGPEPSYFKCKYNCMRINYIFRGKNGYFHMFRSTNVRFFNNMAVVIKSDDEALESLKAICDAILVGIEVQSVNIPFYEGKLERKKTKTLDAESRMANPMGGVYLDIPSLANLPRNVSEGQLLALKNAGTKAINNVTSQLAKFKPMSLKDSFRRQRKEVTKKVTEDDCKRPSTARAEFHLSSSSDSDDDKNPLPIEHNNDVLLESCGILASGQARLESIKAPEIHVNDKECTETEIKTHSLIKISHSEELTVIDKPSISMLEVDTENVPMKTSHSEGAIHNSISGSSENTSATVKSTKDQMLAPLSKLAKGVQNLGINFHRATQRNQKPGHSPMDKEINQILRERCLKSRTRIVQL